MINFLLFSWFFFLQHEHRNRLSVCNKICYAVGGAPYQITGCALGFFLQIYLLDVAQVSWLRSFHTCPEIECRFHIADLIIAPLLPFEDHLPVNILCSHSCPSITPCPATVCAVAFTDSRTRNRTQSILCPRVTSLIRAHTGTLWVHKPRQQRRRLSWKNEEVEKVFIIVS